MNGGVDAAADMVAPVDPQRTAPGRPSWVVWAGLAVVLIAAAVLSFDALRGLALAVLIPDRLAWLLPIAVDAGAAVSCATWLGGRTPPEAARFAGRMTWALLAVTVAGNAGQLGMHAHAITPPWWVAVAVGTIPPAVVGAVVHLVVLLVRGPVDAATPVAAPAVAAPAVADDEPQAVDDRSEADQSVTSPTTRTTADRSTRQRPDRSTKRTAPRVADDVRVAELIASGVGRRKAAKVLGVSPYRAEQLLAHARTAAPQPPAEVRSTAAEGDRLAVNGAVRS